MKNIIWWVVGVLAAITVCYLLDEAVWKYLFFLRAPILMGLFLLLFPLASKLWLSAMLRNLFVLRNRCQLAVVIVGAVAAGVSIVLVGTVILHNAPSRFDVPAAKEVSKFWQYAIAFSLSSCTCIVAIDLSQEELTKQKILWGIFGGVVFSIGLLWAVNLIAIKLETYPAFREVLVNITSLTKDGTEGYIENGELTLGHSTAVAFLLLGVVVYLVVGLFFNPRSQSRRLEAPALLYPLLLISIVTLLYGGATFYLDRFHFPVLILFVLYSACTYTALGIDHQFQLDKLEQDTSDKKAINRDSHDFEQVLKKRLEHQQGERTLVIVCASGGGIQAAGWTVQVLTGLQELLGVSFTKAIGLISSVSGGSVGAMYYLDRFNNLGYPDLEYVDNKGRPRIEKSEKGTFTKIFRSATKDSLDAVGWGLAYLDLWRFIGFPFLIRPKFDRGTAVETDWQGELQSPPKTSLITQLKQIFGNAPTSSGKTLGTWRKEVFAGKIPIPVFNATVVESGDRFLISPMTFGRFPAKKYLDFNSLFKNSDIDIVTAARLSATFPYVSPICRSNDREIKDNYHFADGGYLDNSGFVTAAQWLDEGLEQWRKPESLNIKRVLILQINPFPKSSDNKSVQALVASSSSIKATSSTKSAKVKNNGGLIMATLGPLLTMFKVRDSNQVSRNAREAKLLIAKWREKQVNIDYLPVFFPSESEVDFHFELSKLYKKGKYQPPLSWRLTDGEKQAIQDGWRAIKGGKEIKDVKDWFNKIS